MRYCLITEAVVKKDEPALYYSRGQKFTLERRVDEEDGTTSEDAEEMWEEEEHRLRAVG